MKLITRDTDYALRAVCIIASRRDKLTSAADLVERLKIPRPFLRKLLQQLNTEGILASYKGQGGGFELGRPAEKITLLGLIEIFQGPLTLTECTLKKRPCPRIQRCPVKKKIDGLEGIVRSRLRSITIASLLKERADTIWQKGR